MKLEEAVSRIRKHQDFLKTHRLRFCISCGKQFYVEHAFATGRPAVHCSEWCKESRLQARYESILEVGTKEFEIAHDIAMGRFEFFPAYKETERFCFELET